MTSSESVQKSDVFQWYFSFCAAHFDLTVFIAVSVAILIKVTGFHWTLGTLTPTLSPLFLYEFWILFPANKQTALVHWLHVGCQFSRLHPQWYHNLSEKLLHRESLWRQLVRRSKVYVLSYEGHCWQCFAPHPGKLTNPFLLLASAI